MRWLLVAVFAVRAFTQLTAPPISLEATPTSASAISARSVSAVSAENLVNLPPCAQHCLSSSAQAIGECDQFDFGCLCNNHDYNNLLSCCFTSSCGIAEHAVASQFTTQTCLSVNVTLPDHLADCSKAAITLSEDGFTTVIKATGNGGGAAATTVPWATSTSKSSPSSTSSSSGGKQKGASPAGIIAGATVGGLCGLAFAIIAILLCMRKRRQSKMESGKSQNSSGVDESVNEEKLGDSASKLERSPSRKDSEVPPGMLPGIDNDIVPGPKPFPFPLEQDTQSARYIGRQSPLDSHPAPGSIASSIRAAATPSPAQSFSRVHTPKGSTTSVDKAHDPRSPRFQSPLGSHPMSGSKTSVAPSLPSDLGSKESKSEDARSEVSTLDDEERDHLGLSESTLVGGSFLAGVDVQQQGASTVDGSESHSRPVSPMETDDTGAEGVIDQDKAMEEDIGRGIGNAF